MAEKKLKQHVVCFRVSTDRYDTAKSSLDAQGIVGMKSVNQFFRKLALDFLSGRLVYKNSEDRINPDES